MRCPCTIDVVCAYPKTNEAPELLSKFRGLAKVGPTGFEPATTCTPCRCATRLRYGPRVLCKQRERASTEEVARLSNKTVRSRVLLDPVGATSLNEVFPFLILPQLV